MSWEKMTATSFILNLSRNTPLFSAEVWISFLFFVLFSKDFSGVSVMQKLSRCVWVLIRCGKPILLFFFFFSAVNGEQKETQIS